MVEVSVCEQYVVEVVVKVLGSNSRLWVACQKRINEQTRAVRSDNLKCRVTMEYKSIHHMSLSGQQVYEPVDFSTGSFFRECQQKAIPNLETVKSGQADTRKYARLNTTIENDL